MYDVDLHLEPNEASDLCPVFDQAVLEQHGWDRAFATVLDEPDVSGALALITHDAGAGEEEGWSALPVPVKVSGGGSTEDAEACAVRDGVLYVVGSQFGSKSGPLDRSRAFVARVTERDLAKAIDGKKAKLEVAKTSFAIHRAVNDALARTEVDLLPLGPTTRQAYIDGTMLRGARKRKSWSGRITSADHPINVEGAAFRANGRMLLGLRYPVTREGQPILVELDDPDVLFDDPDAIPHCSNVWILQTGSAEQPVGVRALHRQYGDRFAAIVGNLDAAGKGASVLEDHPAAGDAVSVHVAFDLPVLASGGPVGVEQVHAFDDVRRVEGLAYSPDGRAHYVIDADGRVDLRMSV
jgi:hypothetical protein